MPRRITPILALAAVAALAGCTRKDLPEITVKAATPEEFASFRADLVTEFGAERLKHFDTAVQELKLAAMNRGVAGVAAREAEMCVAINLTTVRQAEISGWKARRQRLLDEIAEITKLLERDARVQVHGTTAASKQAATGRMQTEKDILARLRQDLADTERQLTEWGAPPGPTSAGKAVP